ncbi:MAG: hypothetical protein AB2814_07910 [Candidatus Sedimenticola endophacoides]
MGIFGFIKYNQSALPDIAGSLWKVVPGEGAPLLGLRLRQFVMVNVPHRYFAAPGANVETRPIYHVLGMNWQRMAHYYLLNLELDTYRLATVPPGARAGVTPSPSPRPGTRLESVEAPRQLEAFAFDRPADVAPRKDRAYVCRRFLDHPRYDYQLLLYHTRGEIPALVVCRWVEHKGCRAWCIVDYYGEERHLEGIIPHLYRRLVAQGGEYLDLVCLGFEARALERAGLTALDLDQQALIIPNYFEPFEARNVPLYAVSGRSERFRPRLCRGDGDQDRPNQPLPGFR